MSLLQCFLHRYFGHDYAEVEFGHSFYVRRVRFDGDGRPFVRICDRHIDLMGKGDRKRAWFPLTFPTPPIATVSD